MHEEPRQTAFQAASRGLATLALLKTNFDVGHDHIGMFQPFLLDAICGLDKDDFQVEEIRAAILSRHGLRLPPEILRTLLRRTSRRGLVRREYGRYFRKRDFPQSNIPEATRKIEADHSLFVGELRNYLADHGQPLDSDEDGLALLLNFLERNHVAMVLGKPRQDQPDSAEPPSHRKTRLIVRFIKEVVPPNDRLSAILQRMLEGFILQNALLLKDISSTTRKFKDLRVFLDTRLVLSALGYQGEASHIATTEMLAMLKRTGARLEVFEPTIKEIKSLLYFYQRHLGTSQGRDSLNPTSPLTRFFLTHRYTPADVAELIALLEQYVLQAGFIIRPTPTRIPRYTLDEKDLARRLARTDNPQGEPRVWHDVDCVAAVLTLRGSTLPQNIDSAKAIFLTATGLVVKNVTEWFRQQLEGEDLEGKAEHLLPPVAHQIALSNVAWLKLPASGQKLKLHELIALCSAALQPSRKIWDRFRRHLRNIEASGVITSDEVAAILANHFTDVHLSEFEDQLEDDTDIDSDTLDELIERVRATYAAAAWDNAAKAKHAEEQRRHLQLRIHQQAGKLAATISKGALGVLALLVLAVLLLSLPDSPGPLRRIALPLLLALNIFNLVFGVYVFKYSDRLEARLAAWIRRWLTELPADKSSEPDEVPRQKSAS